MQLLQHLTISWKVVTECKRAVERERKKGGVLAGRRRRCSERVRQLKEVVRAGWNLRFKVVVSAGGRGDEESKLACACVRRGRGTLRIRGAFKNDMRSKRGRFVRVLTGAIWR